mmetsp:Transcript_32153/g.68459  ORF Transcript_32153/g.68459 Transcript_32153/m.68459 type:complete len:437 (-) Transcript_32153:120-1430(-)
MNFAELIQKRQVFLDGNGLGDDDLDVLAEVLQKSEILEDLYLQNNQIAFLDPRFADALARNRTLRVLNLCENQIGGEGAKLLARAVKANDALRQLHLNGNRIGDEGVESLADALMDNFTLQVMVMSDNGIANEGARSLAVALRVNRSLQQLHLGGNDVDDEGVIAVAGALAENGTLQLIDLARNDVGDQGAESLAASLVANEGLRVLELGGNRIGDWGAAKLADALRSNYVVETVDLGDKVGSHAREMIAAILDDPNRESLREMRREHESSLGQMQAVIEQKDKVIQRKDEETASLLKSIEDRDSFIKALRREISARDEEIADREGRIAAMEADPMRLLAAFIASKDERIEFLEVDRNNSNPIVRTLGERNNAARVERMTVCGCREATRMKDLGDDMNVAKIAETSQNSMEEVMSAVSNDLSTDSCRNVLLPRRLP